MNVTGIPTPGQLINGRLLRVEAAKAISAVEIMASKTAGGKCQSAGVLKDFFENCAGALTDISDAVQPTFDSAGIFGSNAARINISFSEVMDTSVTPDISAFTLGGTSKVKASATWINSGQLGITVTVPYVAGNTATIAYTQPETNGLRDRAGNILGSFGVQVVTNHLT